MKPTEMLLIGGLVVGGYVLMTSGALTPKPPYVPNTDGGGGSKEMYNLDAAGKDFEAWLTQSQKPAAQAGMGRLPTGQERVAWWRQEVGFEAAAAWDMEDWYNAYFGTNGVMPTRTMVADALRDIGAENGYSER